VLPKLGTVRLRGIVGNPVSAHLVKLHISLADCDSGVSSSMPVVCAVCPGLNEDLILTSAVVSQLQRQQLNCRNAWVTASRNESDGYTLGNIDGSCQTVTLRLSQSQTATLW